ncbi:MAG: hypothetical protein VYE27_01195 [Pseudomonadota bacterium]|nr:hypothetical protein [Pseudomonadota bacterium]
MKKSLIFLAIAFIFLAVPIYAAARLIVPDWLRGQISASLPEGSSLTIKNIKSNADLSFVYEKVSFSYMGSELNLSEVHFKPRPSLSEPLILESPVVTLTRGNQVIVFKEITVTIIPSNIYLEKLKLKGSVAELDSPESVLLTNMEFVISEIAKKDFKFSIHADAANFTLVMPLGPVIVDFKDLSSDVQISENPQIALEAETAAYNLSSLSPFNPDRIIFAEAVSAALSFRKAPRLEMPVAYRSKELRSPMGKIADHFDLNARGAWHADSARCSIGQALINDKEVCGKLIDVLEVKLSLSDSKGTFQVSGDGICVARGSGCPQTIKAELSSLNTADILTNIMRSNVVNPLLSGVILGSLLGSPADPSSGFDHSVTFDVKGTQIYLNGEPLLQ